MRPRRPLRHLTDRELAIEVMAWSNRVDPAVLDAPAFREYAEVVVLFLDTLNLWETQS